jgi:agmatinase
MKKYSPVDALVSPRFCGIASFMRLPQIRTTEEVDVAFLGIPFDTATTHRVGSRFAPAEIRENSRLLRPYNPAQAIDIFEHCSAVDWGDVDVVPGYIEKTYNRIVDAMQPIFDAGAIPIAMGGDHSITLGELRAASRKYGKIALIQFDSHCDVWEEYFGEKYNHGTPFRHAANEGLIETKNSIQLGIRGPVYSPEDLEAPRDLGFEVLLAREMAKMETEQIVDRIKDRVKDRPVFLSFDIDFVDPAFAPGTGTPEVGGPSSREALEIVRGLTGLDFVGFDLVEVIPQYDSGQITSLLAANLMYEFLSLAAKNMQQGQVKE